MAKAAKMIYRYSGDHGKVAFMNLSVGSDDF